MLTDCGAFTRLRGGSDKVRETRKKGPKNRSKVLNFKVWAENRRRNGTIGEAN